MLSKNKVKRNYQISGASITDNIEIIDNSKCKYIPYKIKYNKEIFYIRGVDPTKNLRVNWRCINYRIKPNLTENQKIFCKVKIQGIRENKESNQFKYYLKSENIEICKNKNEQNEKKK